MAMLHHLAKLTKEMRQAQKDYFKTRDKLALDKSKKLEREVDKCLEQINEGDLFQ